MSKPGYVKRNGVNSKKSSKAGTNNNSPDKSNLDDEHKFMVKFVFVGEKVHSRTPIYLNQLLLLDLLQKTHLDIRLPPPTPRQLFETYFKEDIYPYIRHNIQSHIRNKRDITKLWDSQSQLLQKIYQNRAQILKDEWLNRREKNKNMKQNKTDHDQESLRKKAELKAKNKANKQKWKDQIALQIASGKFDHDDEHKASNKKQNDHIPLHMHQHKNKKKIIKKQQKLPKKKKLKKWKHKKPKNMEELWPIVTKKKVENDVLIAQNRRLIHSELKFKLLIRTEKTQCLIDDDMNPTQMDEIIKYIGCNDLILIKIWIYVDNIKSIYRRKPRDREHLSLNTDRDHVLLSLNESKLFQILWNDFGPTVKNRIDPQHIDVVFVKKSKTLRLKIPILSL